MTIICIYINIQRNCCYRSGKAYISVSCTKEVGYKIANTGFKCFKHYIWTKSTSFNLEFLIPSKERDDCYKCLKLCQASNGIKNTIKFKNGDNNVYVYFYGKDPRPLMLCYNNKTFIPIDKELYFKKWFPDYNISKSLCKCTGEEQKEPLLNALVWVVGFLNQVELQMHPNNNGDKEKCKNNGVAGKPNTCKTEKNSNSSCTYEVHKYNSQDIKVKVTCSEVKGPGEKRDGCNYKKMTHEPIGTNGAGAKAGPDSGFRLGDVVYNNGSEKGRIEYYTNGTENGDTQSNRSDHWWKPLISVSAYFYEEDKCYKDPLLVVLEFANGNGAGTVCDYYRLKTDSASGGRLEWEKDTGVSYQMSIDNYNYLDGIRYSLKKVLKVEIACKEGYAIQLSKQPGGSANKEFSQLPNGASKNITVEVKVCEEGVCKKLKESGYKCFKHKLTDLSEGFDYNSIGGVAFYIPTSLPKGDTSPEDNGKEVTLYKRKTSTELLLGQQSTGTQNSYNGEEFEPFKTIYYNKCMGYIFVYFYGEDPLPLMLCYDGNAYKPNKLPEQGTNGNYDFSTEEYTKWYNVKEIKSCLCKHEGGECIK